MNALAPIGLAPLPSLLLQEDEDAAYDYALAEKSAATRKCYQSDFKIFTRYCAERGIGALPALPATVCAFLAAEARGGAKASTIGRRCAAIRYAHRLAGHEAPTNAEAVKATMRGIRRTIGAAPVRKAPATADLVRLMLDQCPPTMRGKRDRALLALGFAGAFRRSELVALTVADLVAVPDGYRVMIRHSKTDQEGAGQEIAIPRGSKLQPVLAVEEWLRAADITEGFVFRPVTRGGRVAPVAGLTPDSVADIVKAYIGRIGLIPAGYAAHSLRSGFLTSGAEAGASVFKLMEVSRHKSVDVLSGYVRRTDMFRDHAGASFL